MAADKFCSLTIKKKTPFPWTHMSSIGGNISNRKRKEGIILEYRICLNPEQRENRKALEMNIRKLEQS